MECCALYSLCVLAFLATSNFAYAADSTALQLNTLNQGNFKLRAKRSCQMGECGPEEYFMICRKCPICCLEPTSTPRPMPPPQPTPCCQPLSIPVPVSIPVPRPQQPMMPENPQSQCCYSPRPSPQCCQAPPPSTPEVILCCQMRPEPANPCCQAAAAATSQAPQSSCVCAAPRPIPCRCSAPSPPSSPTPEMECVLASCPIYISRCPMNPAVPQPPVCKKRRFRRDTYQMLLQQISHNIPFEF